MTRSTAPVSRHDPPSRANKKCWALQKCRRGPEDGEAVRLPFHHLKGMSRHPPLRQAQWRGSLAACGRFGEALDLLARHHHSPLRRIPRLPDDRPGFNEDPLHASSSEPIERLRKVRDSTAPRSLPPQSFQRRFFPRAAARPSTYLRSFHSLMIPKNPVPFMIIPISLYDAPELPAMPVHPPVLCGLARPTSPATAPASNCPLQPAAEFLAKQNCRLPPSSAVLRPTLPPKSASRGCKPGS